MSHRYGVFQHLTCIQDTLKIALTQLTNVGWDLFSCESITDIDFEPQPFSFHVKGSLDMFKTLCGMHLTKRATFYFSLASGSAFLSESITKMALKTQITHFDPPPISFWSPQEFF